MPDKIAEARRTAASQPTAENLNALGALLYNAGNIDEAVVSFNQALSLDADFAPALNNVGVAYRHSKRPKEAVEAFRKAIHLRPELLDTKINLRQTYRDLVPTWHFSMMADVPRNEAYDAAIRRAVPGKRVLEIGTGAGLLAMMSARAGAASVLTCDGNGVVANAAREIIAANGYSQKITVLNKWGHRLTVAPSPNPDLQMRAEVFVSELFDSRILGDNVLGTMEDVHERLVTPDAKIIPRVAELRGYLAGGEELESLLFANRAAGFDVSRFDEFAPPTFGAILNDVPHDVMSEDATLFRFDFRERRFPTSRHADHLIVTKSGICAGVIAWMRLEMDELAVFENRPMRGARGRPHWSHVFHRFERTVPVNAGDAIPIVVQHDRSHINIVLAE